jgi:hypothetical protein
MKNSRALSFEKPFSSLRMAGLSLLPAGKCPVSAETTVAVKTPDEFLSTDLPPTSSSPEFFH